MESNRVRQEAGRCGEGWGLTIVAKVRLRIGLASYNLSGRIFPVSAEGSLPSGLFLTQEMPYIDFV
jgi:hypothetical protein